MFYFSLYIYPYVCLRLIAQQQHGQVLARVVVHLGDERVDRRFAERRA